MEILEMNKKLAKLQEYIITDQVADATLDPLSLEEDVGNFKEGIWRTIYQTGLEKERLTALLHYLLVQLGEISERAYLMAVSNNLLIDEINKFIDYLGFHFSIYFNNSLHAPEAYKKFLFQRLEDQWSVQLGKLNAPGRELELKELLIRFFSSLNTGRVYKYKTYEDLDYYTELSEGISRRCKDKADSEIYQIILMELVYQNFNACEFIEFILREWKLPYDKEGDLEEVIKKMTVRIKELKLLPTKTAYRLVRQAPSVKAVLIKNAKERLKEVKKKLRSQLKVYKETVPSQESELPYFQVDLTLPQLLFFFKLMIEAKILVAKNRTGLYKFLANHIGTKKQSNLSVNSMQRKFGSIDTAGVKRVKIVLFKMIQMINQQENKL